MGFTRYRNSGGGTFLVDSDGTLLAVGASADEVREILRKKLGGKSGALRNRVR